jgi:soluble cytochrome b562
MNLTNEQYKHCYEVLKELIIDHLCDGDVESAQLLAEDLVELRTCYHRHQEMSFELQKLVETLLE